MENNNDVTYPKWLLLMFGSSLAVLFVSFIGIIIEGITTFPEPPIFFILVMGIAMIVNIVSIAIAKAIYKQRNKETDDD